MKITTALVWCFVTAAIGGTLLVGFYWYRVLPAAPVGDDLAEVCEGCLAGARKQWDCGAQKNKGGCGNSEPKWVGNDREFCEKARATEMDRCLEICQPERDGFKPEFEPEPGYVPAEKSP